MAEAFGYMITLMMPDKVETAAAPPTRSGPIGLRFSRRIPPTIHAMAHKKPTMTSVYSKPIDTLRWTPYCAALLEATAKPTMPRIPKITFRPPRTMATIAVVFASGALPWPCCAGWP